MSSEIWAYGVSAIKAYNSPNLLAEVTAIKTAGFDTEGRKEGVARGSNGGLTRAAEIVLSLKKESAL